MAICLCFLAVAGCAPILGYPRDPEDTDQTLARLDSYFNGVKEAAYLADTTLSGRTQKRNEIVFARMHAYDIAFADFERRIYGDANAVSVGSDLVGLVLGGLTATTGNAATKSALGAAATGVLGANTAITKDLYYQKTVPALLAQMEANRLQARQIILLGLKKSDAEYPLMQAYVDLDAYKSSGGIPNAINRINLDAGLAKEEAQDAITADRGPADFARLPTVETVLAALNKLTTDRQFIAVANAMQPYLAGRSAEVRAVVKTIDPDNTRLSTNGRRARQALMAWIQEDDMTPLAQQQWMVAIASAGAMP